MKETKMLDLTKRLESAWDRRQWDEVDAILQRMTEMALNRRRKELHESPEWEDAGRVSEARTREE